MKRSAAIATVAAFLLGHAIFNACAPEADKGEVLARQYCATCHLFPEPQLLDKKSWTTGVLPEMAFRMGLDKSRKIPQENGQDVVGIPEHPMLSKENWELIKKYFEANAPDALTLPIQKAPEPLTNFSPSTLRIQQDVPFVCLLQADTVSHKFYWGTHQSRLYEVNENLKEENAFRLPSPPSHILFESENNLLVSTMGILEPNDERKGEVFLVEKKESRAHSVIKDMKRPVHLEQGDFNGDGKMDYVACEFGNIAGALELYENKGDEKFEKHTLMSLPGSRRVVVKDINGDGLLDVLALFTQGNEELVQFTNKGGFEFEASTILRFPSVYGSSYFELIDFNHDGHDDIIYSCGDNYDYSPILKPYHGIYIYLNDGKQNFTQDQFLPMYGASMMMTRDYDKDGDLDIAAISFFPDFDNAADEGFIYFENKGKTFVRHTTPVAASGRWLVIEAADIDRDGDCDILLGAYDVAPPPNMAQRWENDKTAVLILRNKVR